MTPYSRARVISLPSSTTSWLPVISAAIAALASIAAAVISWNSSRRSAIEQQKIERLKSEIESRRSLQGARQAYEYAARQRLYLECEPLLFQLCEAAEIAERRIGSLARYLKGGGAHENDHSGLTPLSYYFRSTIYYLLAPAAIFHIIRQRLTAVDLTVDPQMKLQYTLAKIIYFTMTRADQLSRYDPRIEYLPIERQENAIKPSEFDQAIAVGKLDRISNSLVVSENGERRILTFGEFEDEFQRGDQSSLHRNVVPFSNVVRDFHPLQKPVFWRLLISELYLYRALIATRSRGKEDLSVDAIIDLARVSKSDRPRYDWRTTPGEAPDDVVLGEPFSIAKKYLRNHLIRSN
jgi:hypothetical protein